MISGIRRSLDRLKNLSNLSYEEVKIRIESRARGIFQQVPRNLLKNSLFRKAASRVENSWPTNGPESIGSGLAMVC
jgi:hypothetical protein